MKHRTAGHQEVKNHIKTAAHKKCLDSSSSKMSAGYRESPNETQNLAAYRKCLDLIENRSANHRNCQDGIKDSMSSEIVRKENKSAGHRDYQD
jgi:hypothetical protein